ncbi:unnamed protein product [Rhodiola kirilowii]
MKQMKEMMTHLMRREPVKVKPCEFCGAMDHKTDSCPTLQEEDHGDVNALGNYQGYQNRAGPSRPYGQGPAGEAWRHGIQKDFAQQSHHQQAPPQVAHDVYRPPHRQFQQGPNENRLGPVNNQAGPSTTKSLEDIVRDLAVSQAKTDASLQQHIAKSDSDMAELNKKMAHLTEMFSESRKEPGRLPSQTIQNPRGNVSAVTLRSGKRLVDDLNEHEEGKEPKEMEENQVGPDFMPGLSDASQALGTTEPDAPGGLQPGQPGQPDASENSASASEGLQSGQPDASENSASASEDLQPGQPDASKNSASASEEPAAASDKLGSSPVQGPEGQKTNLSVPLPFPVPARKSKKYVMDKDVWELFSRVEINIPLLEAIKQIPSYAKFLKELCTNRRRGAYVDQELMSKNVSAMIPRAVPPKCSDPGTYTIPCTIGNIRIENCMLDLGASINVLPYSIYSCLRIGPLEPAGLTIQLADRSCKQPEGKIEDVLVRVGELVFPADFYVLKMENCGPNDHAPILLGRPFLTTSKMKIDCGTGMLSLEVEGEVINFDIFRAMKHPQEFETVHAMDTLDDLIHEVQPEREIDPLEIVLERALYSSEGLCELTEGIEGALTDLGISLPLTPCYEVNEISLFKTNTCLPSIVQAPELELKPLPGHLKYVFLGENETLPVIIKSGLEMDQERRLIEVLARYKRAIGWTLGDLRGISPVVCMHRILMEDGTRPSREPQRRLNPIMMEVVKKEIQKLVDADVIYPISDSKWVSPVHVVPKKTGITIEENDEGKMVATRVKNGWRMCVDYRKLNAMTRKDHFPLPFIDQMLDRLAGKPFFCFLDGFSGYNQIPIAPEDQEKTTFTCQFGTFAFRRMSFGLCNAPGTFQRVVTSIFSDMIGTFIEVFMDDFTVHGGTFDECLKNLSLGIEVDKAKIDVIKTLPYPCTVRDINSFLGHAGFYRRFIKDFSKKALPLSTLLQKDVPFEFTKECKEAFDELKHALTSTPIIRAPDWSKGFEIMCDASDYAIGAVLGQRDERKPVVIYYASRTLDSAQRNYSTTEKELLAVVFALEKFRSYLLGTKVIGYSDHAAIRYLMTKKEAKPRLIRWIL